MAYSLTDNSTSFASCCLPLVSLHVKTQRESENKRTLGMCFFRLLNTFHTHAGRKKADGYVDFRVCFGAFFCHDTKEYTSAYVHVCLYSLYSMVICTWAVIFVLCLLLSWHTCILENRFTKSSKQMLSKMSTNSKNKSKPNAQCGGGVN